MLLFFIIILILAQPIHAVDNINIDSERDPRLLRYSLESQGLGQYTESKYKIKHPYLLYKTAIGESATAIVINAYNGDESINEKNHVLLESFEGKTMHENPLRMIIHDMCTFYKSQSDSLYIAAACYRNDSAFVVKIIPFCDQKDTLFLCSSENYSGDGIWMPLISFVGSFDYDYDSQDEIFVWVNTIGGKPRELYCIDANKMEIEWNLPVASTICMNRFLMYGDSINPCVAFTSYGPC
jgi:hypothetical protein